MRTLAALLCAVLTAGVALADPPAPGSPLATRLRPYKGWIEGQWIPCKNPPSNTCWCCSIADGRPVEAVQQRDGHWRAHVTPENWPGQPDMWIDVPPQIEVQHSPLMFEGFLWRSPITGQNFCFAPPGGGV